MWKLTPYGKTRTPLTGVPWRDLTDSEFEAAEKRHEELRERGYFEHGESEAAPKPANDETARLRPQRRTN